ncbi:unnamed protein product [Polarella glacialis]|uniref:Uncharacterized protein n=1 Tax=Polarella glacialis TaxID=89957 RepID=A0A813FFG3_POLGL|nr:unnamed protein product [Polarella glacialis]
MGLGASAAKSRRPPAQPPDHRQQASSSVTEASVEGDVAPVSESDVAPVSKSDVAPVSESGSSAPSAVPHAIPQPTSPTSPAAPASPAAAKAATQDLVNAVEAEDWSAAEEILRKQLDIDPNARTSDWGYSLLRAAAEEGAHDTCKLLLERKADVNGQDKNRMTPLMGCIVGGDHGEIVSMLLEAGADAAAVTDDGFSALQWATRLNREESIALLRAAGMTGAATCF